MSGSLAVGVAPGWAGGLAIAEAGWWAVGALALLLGVLLAVLSQRAGSPRAQVTGPSPAAVLNPRAQEARHHVLLGELLVGKYGFITAEDLELGLERQKLTGLRIGETLVKMGLLRKRQLEQALADQQAAERAA